jgi:hypothetical protein
MLGTVELALPTLCLGIDVTWWGGSPRRRDSQRDTIVYGIVQAGTAPDLRFSLVDLSVAPNPDASLTEANFDSDGELLVSRVAAILEENRGHFQRCVVALDAPLEARTREKQLPRAKAADAGTGTGATCTIADDTRNSGTARKGKEFDDPIESGLAFLTAFSFVGGFSHTWGDGSDGTIVGPGLLRGR